VTRVRTLSSRLAGMIPSRDKEGNAMTDLNCENRELSIDELTTDELDSVSGGRIKLPVPDAVKAWEIANIQRDNPGF
jgi:bacteriocin-like protein